MRTVGKTALREVRVFDGQGLTEPRTVVIDGAVIGADATGAEVVDAVGGPRRYGDSTNIYYRAKAYLGNGYLPNCSSDCKVRLGWSE